MESHCESKRESKSDVPAGRKARLWGKSLEQTNFKQQLWEEAVSRRTVGSFLAILQLGYRMLRLGRVLSYRGRLDLRAKGV